MNEWYQKEPKTPVASENGAPAGMPTSAEAHVTNTSPEGWTSTAEVEINHQRLDSNGRSFGPNQWALKQQRHTIAPFSKPSGTTLADFGSSGTMKTTRTTTSLLPNTNNKHLTPQSLNNTTYFK
jgi:hypothetical protein